MRIQGTFLALALLCAPACVTQATHELLQQDYDKLKAEFAQTKAEREAYGAEAEQARKQLEGALAAERNKVTSIEGQLAALKMDIGSLQSQKAELLKTRSQLKASVAEMTQALAEAQKRKALAEQRMASYKDLLNRFQGLIDAGKLRVRIIDGRMVVQLATDILFPSGSAKLSAEGQDAIRQVAGVLITMPERRFEIAGNTDNIPVRSSNTDNWALGFKRAYAVLMTMIEEGMAPERISAASYGEFRPVASNDTEEGRAANRRIEIVIVPDLSSLPGAEELEGLGS